MEERMRQEREGKRWKEGKGRVQSKKKGRERKQTVKRRGKKQQQTTAH